MDVIPRGVSVNVCTYLFDNGAGRKNEMKFGVADDLCIVFYGDTLNLLY